MTHSQVKGHFHRWRDWFVWDMTHSYVTHEIWQAVGDLYDWFIRDTFTCHTPPVWLINTWHIWHMWHKGQTSDTYAYITHTCVSITHTCVSITHTYASISHTCVLPRMNASRHMRTSHVAHAWVIYDIRDWYIRDVCDSCTCDMTRSHVTWRIHTWQDSFICDIYDMGGGVCVLGHTTSVICMSHGHTTWVICMSHMTDAYLTHTTHSYATWLLHAWHDSFIRDMTHLYVTWLIRTWHEWYGRRCRSVGACRDRGGGLRGGNHVAAYYYYWGQKPPGVLQIVAECCSELQWVAGYCCGLQCVAVCL